MFARNFSVRRVAAESSLPRIVWLAVPVLALSLGACSRDELAPDCFLISAEGQCLVPDPGGTAPGINCATMPQGAVGATYNFPVVVGGGSGSFNMWMASGLPPTLTIDPNTGVISGIPSEAMTYDNVELSMFDAGKGESFTAECGPLVINPALNPNRVLMEPNHCIPHTASRAQMVALLDGGDDTEITCSALSNSSTNTICPLGDGNGRMAPGITFNESSCTHSGTVTGDRRGTWVWMVEVTQNGAKTRVPFCASRDNDAFHDIAVAVDTVPQSDLVPGLYEYNANNDLLFGADSYRWTIENPACPGTDCNRYGFRFSVTCSPFDTMPAPWQVTLDPADPEPVGCMAPDCTGMFHHMTASGPAPGSSFANRPFTASFEISYCTSPDMGFCDTNDATQFEQNAQTKYHFSVVGFPTLTP